MAHEHDPGSRSMPAAPGRRCGDRSGCRRRVPWRAAAAASPRPASPSSSPPGRCPPSRSPIDLTFAANGVAYVTFGDGRDALSGIGIDAAGRIVAAGTTYPTYPSRPDGLFALAALVP